ncbi:protein MpRLK-Pelle_RLCK-Via [Marchantia polymorpha subsp. ruderalis]|uniref:Protein kinase domain-containing protein n=2 Tax=Marchantia polymorpha TaxID=3197 RepID=A0AAF6AKI4_MARPO|nr:hypothetical protein MARPO_0029s0060 [Marchantia polymorpha]BBM96954.1 hypothetical protein Mp_1g01860 [Marchantia polymorpha subsp. ruderalis]|eukprot:PTQ42527.1 hypothetical protein MARPO_0029s0060 [Marchantia polymorpha]
MGRELVTTPSRLFRGKEMMSPSRLFRRPSMPKCPVAALQEGHQRILVAVKMTEQSGELIRWALTEAARTGDTLTVMHVTEPWAAAQTSAAEHCDAVKEELLDTLSALVLSSRLHSTVPAKVTVTVEVVEGDNVGTAIVTEARQMKATMVVLGKCESQMPLSPKRMTELGRLCVKSLSSYCNVVVVRKGKMMVCRPGTAKADMRQSLRVLLESERGSLSELLQGTERMSDEEFHDEPGRRSSSSSSVCSSLYEKFAAADGADSPPAIAIAAASASFSRASSMVSDRSSDPSSSSFSSNGSPNSVLDRFAKLQLRPDKARAHLDQFLADAACLRSDRSSSSSSVSVSGSLDGSSPEPEPELVAPQFHLGSECCKSGPLEAVSEEDADAAAEPEVAPRTISPPLLARTCSELKYELSESGLLSLQHDLEEQMPSIRRFAYQELQEATDDFSPENLVGTGMASSVYKARLRDGSWAAVKRLEDRTCVGEKEFMMEIMMLICTHHHPNLVTLVGFCAEGTRRSLVYEYLARGNLEQNLYGDSSRSVLSWAQRQNAAVGAASGLAYLHQFKPRPIIHRDVKSQNILLRENFEAQVSDFGLARWCSDGSADASMTTSVAGTFGYMAPECFMYGNFDEKTDVFSFGVVLLELISGRKPIDRRYPESQQSLVQWARLLQRKREMHKLVDPRLTDINPHQFKRMMYTAFLCIEISPDERPSMDRVVKLLDPQCEYCEEPLLFAQSSSPPHCALPVYMA